MQYKGKWLWIGLGALALIVRWIGGYYPEMIEQFYSRGLYLGIRRILDYTIGILPFPVVYLILIGAFAYLIYSVYWFISSQKTWLAKLGQSVLGFLAFTAAIAFFFLFLWGFNYGRISISDKLMLATHPLSKQDLENNLTEVAQILDSLRAQIGTDSVAVTAERMQSITTKDIRSNLQTVLTKTDYPANFSPKVQELRPKGILLRFQTLGVYFPWSGECNLDAGLHPLEKPFVTAHELVHGYGFGDEGTCNFLALLACLNSEQLEMRYAGYFEYFSTLAVNLRKYDRQGYYRFLSQLSPAVKADWNSIVENHAKYPNIVPELRRATYNTYLKVQGISEGIQNYNKVLVLAEAWKEQVGSLEDWEKF